MSKLRVTRVQRPLMIAALVVAALAFLAVISSRWLNTGSSGLSNQDLAVPSSSQTIVPAQDSVPDPGVFERLKSMPTRLPSGGSAITGPVTEVSIRKYIAANPSVGGIEAQNVQVTGIKFITIGEMKSLFAEGDHFWDSSSEDEQVAYVTLSGDFVALTDPSASDLTATTTYHSAYRVFSVRTGNELGGGVGSK